MDDTVANISFILVGGVAAILNLVEIVLICKTQKNFKSYEQLLLSLSASDLVSGLAFLFLLLPTALMKLPEQRHITKMGLIMTFMLSAANLMFIGVDRLIKVRFPIKHTIWVTPRKTKTTIIIMWTVVLVHTTGLICTSKASPKILDKIFHLITPFSILSGVIFFTMIYAYIIYIVITRKSPSNSHHEEHQRQDKVLVTTCASIIVIFIACSYPIAIDILFIPNKASETTSILLVVNSVLDPPVYFFNYYYDKRQRTNLSIPQGANESDHLTKELVYCVRST